MPNYRFAIHNPRMESLTILQSMNEIYDWGLKDLNIPEIHKQTFGENIKIALIDSGKSSHYETINNTIGAINLTHSRKVDDMCGHSTFCAGIIAAEKNNRGIIGVAPKSKIYFIKAIDDNGKGNPSTLAGAIYWAVRQKVDIISISAGMFVDLKFIHRAIKRAYNNNIVIIAACGNTGSKYYNIAFPARYPEVIGVAAYDKQHKTAKFSSRGANIAFALPGVDIYSTHLNNQYCSLSGTSFATPLLSGICALILAKHRSLGIQSNTPCNTPKQMLEHLKKYAIKLNGPNTSGFGTIDTRSMFEKEI